MRSDDADWTAPPWVPEHDPSLGQGYVLHGGAPAPWAIRRQGSKSGAGLLFFAYGASRSLNHFLSEAENAARSFREHNPRIAIAVVTNNATVNKAIFDIHVSPRSDLLFTGENLQDRPDKINRQWLTRVYFMAHSPFEITWALDSNVVSCTPGAAQRFLDAAQMTQLWNMDILHATQNFNVSKVMYPHNFNIAYRWSRRTSHLMRDWLLLTIRNGVASDDQKSLHWAELRQIHNAQHQYERDKLRVGRILPAYGAAFYNVLNTSSRMKREDGARVTPILTGRVHVLHSTNLSLCTTFNSDGRLGEYPDGAANGTRQMLMLRAGHASGAITRHVTGLFRYRAFRTQEDCVATLDAAGGARACLFGDANTGGVDDFAVPALMEDLSGYLNSSRCKDCED